MNFEPKTEKQIQVANLMPKGIYGVEVPGAEDKISKSGREMIELDLLVYDVEGHGRKITDYLVSGVEGMEFKIRHAAVTFGLEEKYNTGTLLAADFIGRSGHCKIGIKEDKTGQYAPKNNITDYVSSDIVKAAPQQKAAETNPLPNDDIPF